MKKNRGATDRITRILIAAIIASLYFTQIISGTIAIIALALAVIFVLTSWIGTCPLYLPFDIHTNQKNKK